MNNKSNTYNVIKMYLYNVILNLCTCILLNDIFVHSYVTSLPTNYGLWQKIINITNENLLPAECDSVMTAINSTNIISYGGADYDLQDAFIQPYTINVDISNPSNPIYTQTDTHSSLLPSTRTGSMIVYSKVRHVAYMFGGFTYSDILGYGIYKNDVWEFDLIALQWTLLNAGTDSENDGNYPLPRGWYV